MTSKVCTCSRERYAVNPGVSSRSPTRRAVDERLVERRGRWRAAAADATVAVDADRAGELVGGPLAGGRSSASIGAIQRAVEWSCSGHQRQSATHADCSSHTRMSATADQWRFAPCCGTFSLVTTTRTILRSLAAIAAIPAVVAGAAGVRYTARAAAARRDGTSLEPGVPTPAPRSAWPARSHSTRSSPCRWGCSPPSGRPSTTHVRRTSSTRPSLLRRRRLARRSGAPASGTHGACPTPIPVRSPERTRAAALRQRLGAGRSASRAANGGAPSLPTRGRPSGSCATRAAHARGSSPSTGRAWGGRRDDRMLRVPPAPRGARRQHRPPRAPAARPTSGRVRPRPAVRLQRLSRQQRARADAVGLGPPPAAAVAPRPTRRRPPSGCSGCRSAPTRAACCRPSRPTWPAWSRSCPRATWPARCGRPSRRSRRSGRLHQRAVRRAARRSSTGSSRRWPAVPRCPTIGASSSPGRPTGSPRPTGAAGAVAALGRAVDPLASAAATSPRGGRPSTTTTSPPILTSIGLHVPREASGVDPQEAWPREHHATTVALPTGRWWRSTSAPRPQHHRHGRHLRHRRRDRDGPPTYDEVLEYIEARLHVAESFRERMVRRAVRPRPAVVDPGRRRSTSSTTCARSPCPGPGAGGSSARRSPASTPARST